jgi:hydrogenase maturation protease
LRARGVASDDVRLLDAGTDGMAVIFAARGCRTLIIIDACRSGSEAGAIFELPGAELARQYQPSLNLHDFRWDHALHAGCMLLRDEFPTDVMVLLIEVENVDFGVGLSPAVSAATAKVVDRVEALILARKPAAQPAP